MEESLGKFMNESAKRHEENSNLIKEIQASTDAAIKNQGASIMALDIQIGQMSKVLQERVSGSLPSSTKMNPRDHVNSISITVETETTPIRHIGSTRYAVSAQQNSKLIFKPRQANIPFPSHLYYDSYDKEKGSYVLKDLDAYSIRTTLRNDALPRKEKDPGSFTLPCYINYVCFEKALADLRASVNRTVKHPKRIAKNVLVGIGKFVFPVDFIILDMPEDVNVPLILIRRFFSTAHAKVDVFKRKITLRVGGEKIIFKSVKPASILINSVYMLSFRERMDLDLEARLVGETLILNRSFDLLYEDYIELNDLNEPLEFRRYPVDDLEPTVEEGDVNDPMIDIVKTRCDFIIVEDMGPYLDERIEDVIVGEPFCKASCVEARRFDGIITIRNGDDSLTYQMVRSNPRFKHLTNEKCNMIPPLLKVSEQDKMNGISHSYKKLKGFYKGVLNLGSEFIRDAKVEEWLTRGHISVHEME
ncbi:hypothetical protein Tco_1035281 [Tanacetum coccineum]